jgi:hypothetical protein
LTANGVVIVSIKNQLKQKVDKVNLNTASPFSSTSSSQDSLSKNQKKKGIKSSLGSFFKKKGKTKEGMNREMTPIGMYSDHRQIYIYVIIIIHHG